MKTGFLICASAALFYLAAALPMPADVVVTAVVVDDYEIYVNENGIPYMTRESVTTEVLNSATAPIPRPSAPAPVATSAHVPKNTPVPAQSNPAPKSAPAPAPSVPAHASSAPVAARPSPSKPASAAPVASPSTPKSSPVAGPAFGPGFRSGISYSPYNTDQSCKSAGEVALDVAELKRYSIIRLYGTDCNQIAHVLAALRGSSTKIFAGIYDPSQVSNEAQSLIAQVGGNWKAVNTISVGNEQISKGLSSIGAVTAAIGTARSALRSAGYHGPVVTVDTMVAMQNNIELCKASDYCAFNCHAFFDGNVLPADAGSFVKGWVHKIGTAAGKAVVVTESGWPSSGTANGKAVPSAENQAVAIKSLKAAFPKNLVLYSAFDNKWMQDGAKTFNSEHFWGILGSAPSA